MGETKKGAQKRGFLNYLGTRGKLGLLIGAAVIGVCLLLWGSLGGSEEKSETVAVSLGNTPKEMENYEEALEKDLELLCEAVEGVADVRVLVSFSAGWRTVYATDASGGPATVGSGSSAVALETTVTPPAVAGVGIVCRGGNDPNVQKKLIDLVSTVLGIPSNRVSVAGR